MIHVPQRGEIMGLVVQKYGGTSVGDIDRIRNVARRVVRTYEAGNDVVVILSAMAGVTDSLIGMSRRVCPDPDKRELDQLLATGEQTTAALLAMMLIDMHCPAQSLLGFQADIVTDCTYGNARIVDINARRILDLVGQRKIVVVAGFQGWDPNGNITTLGRGGSDTSAVAIAAAIKAETCEIYTDVDGIYTADPNICSKARKIRRIAYEEMLELASLGAKVLQIRSVEFAAKYNVPVHVRSSFSEEEGTMVVCEESGMERLVVSGVTSSKNEARIAIRKVPDIPGIAARIFTPIAEAGIQVDLIIQSIQSGGKNDLTFTVPKGDMAKTMEIGRRIAAEIGAEEVLGDDSIAKISVVGVGMKNHSGVAARMFSTLAAENINIRLIGTSEIRISCVVDEKYAELAVRALHTAFGLDKEPEESGGGEKAGKAKGGGVKRAKAGSGRAKGRK
jgi:aspartate kinase